MLQSIRPFSRRIRKIEVSAIKQMALRATNYSNVISFGWGVPSFKSRPEIRQAVIEAFEKEPFIDRYAPVPGLPELREKIARLWQKWFGYEVSPKEVIVTAGAMEAMMGLMLTLFDPEDEVLVMDPGFASHIEEMELTGVVPAYVPLDESRGWRLTESTLRKAVSKKSRGIILINPNNPTGHVYSRQDIELIGRVVLENNLWLILDEPYEFMVYDGIELFHPLHIPELRNHVIDVRSFSKKYSMTGWRVGYFVACRELIAQFMKFHDNTIVSAPRVSQVAAMRALDIPDEVMKEEIEVLHTRRDLICGWLDKMPDLFSYVRPTGAYYVFPKILAPMNDIEFSDRLLTDKQVVTTPGSAFGPASAGHVRLCFSNSEEEINEGMKRIQEWWGKNK